MSKDVASDEKQQAKRPKPDHKGPAKQRPTGPSSTVGGMLHLQRLIGNRAVQRLMAQRSGDGSFELDDTTADRINQARGGGQPLDGAVQAQMSEAMGHDFSGVKVHTSGESDNLNQQLSARAFTTGQDIFFKQGEYNPGSSSGKELIAHELTHVVQQSSGTVGGGGGRMTVNPPGDVYEQEADAVAKQAVNAGNSGSVQTAKATVQREDVPPMEEEVQTKAIQREDAPPLEEEVQTKAIQREDAPPLEEEVQTKAIQREEAIEEETEEG